MAPLAMGMMGAGTGAAVAGNLIAGQNAMKAANEQAHVDRVNAGYAKQNAIDSAGIIAEKGQKLLAVQKAGYATSGIRANSDVVGVAQQKTIEDITKDIGFTLQRGRQEYGMLRQQARDAVAAGEAARQQSDWNAVGAGLSGGAEMASFGYKAGMFGSTPPPTTGITGGGGGYDAQGFPIRQS